MKVSQIEIGRRYRCTCFCSPVQLVSVDKVFSDEDALITVLWRKRWYYCGASNLTEEYKKSSGRR